jgi:hypothetical protein
MKACLEFYQDAKGALGEIVDAANKRARAI